MAVTYVTVSNGQKVDNIFLRPVFDADSRGDLRFGSFCHLQAVPEQISAIACEMWALFRSNPLYVVTQTYTDIHG